ncbi:helix-turn-helix transcriptional regulator [Rothia kristinae]|uniref:helix-turn-helix transcriptional regulator n=1 Tax=Rothia kristinae TaxID=37923 RepID=UPI0034053FF3
MSTTVEPLTVTARRWAHGWELIISEDDATQVRSLAHARQQVRDYLDTIDPDTDHSEIEIRLIPEEGADQIEQARRARQEAEAAEAQAAQAIREVVADLRHRRGYSITDTAALLGLSRGRISQLEQARSRAA